MSPAPARRPSASVAGSPVLIGAVTVLVALVAVFLGYNANNGLPFVPTRTLKVDFPNGNELVKGNQVREGGERIGFVSGLVAMRLPDGHVGARATLLLDKSAGAFPTDSTATLRPVSALGLEYVDMQRGSSGRAVADGGTLPAAQAQTEPEFDQVLATFDQPTRDASRANLYEYGNAFAGRGADLSRTISLLPRTFGLLSSVAGNLNDRRTRLSTLFPSLDRTASAIAPVAGTFAHLFTTMANTFAAIDRDPQALRSTIALTPGTLDVGTRSLAAQLPFLRDSVPFAHDLAGAARELAAALPTVNQALVVATRVTRRTPVLYGNLEGTMTALRDLAQAPTTNAALRGLTATVATLQPQLRFLGPYITVCNYWNMMWTFLAESMSAPAPGGQAMRILGNNSNQASNSLGMAGAAAPANGEAPMAPGAVPEFLHAQPYGAAVTNSGAADCEVGQRGYINRSPGAPPGFNIAMDPHNSVGYAAGPTYQYFDRNGPHGLGATQVPAGETFTREPGGLGAQVDPNLRGSP